MEDPKALGTVLAMLVDGAGKPVRGGGAKGQLYASGAGLVVLRPPPLEQLGHRLAAALLVGSIAAVILNLFTLKRMAVIWIALAAQAIYWLTLPARRRMIDPVPLAAAALEEARRAGRAAISVPAEAIVRAVAPEPPRPGFRRPARFELADGALEIYLSAEQFAEAAAAVGRTGAR